MVKRLLLNDLFIIIIIAINAVIIFVQGFDPPTPLSTLLDNLDNIITVIFILEALTKIRVFGVRGYFSSGWNTFDFVLVFLALPSLITWLFQLNLYTLEFLLIFRIMRVFKFFRFLRFIPNVAHLMDGVGRAIKSSILIVFGFFVFNFIVALISCFLFKDLAPEYFDDPIISFYSIFKVFTIEGWFEIPDDIAKVATPSVTFFTRMYFIIVLFFGGIFGLSLVNSIFVDTMVSDNNDELEAKILQLEDKIDSLISLTNTGKNK